MNQYVPKEITEEVNVTPVHPLVNLGYLFGTVAVLGMAIYVVLGLAASQIATRLGPQTEEKIGASLTAQLSAQVIKDDDRVEYLQALVTELEAAVAQTDRNEAVYPPVKIGILDTEVENAMVAAGSYMFVTNGLLKNVESENELAFVLAHELAHLHHRDTVRALGRSLVFVTISSLLGLGQQGTWLPGVANIAELSYSRHQETAADDYALEAVVTHYQHGDHTLGFFERNQGIDLGALNKVAEWQSTHPLSSDRIEHLEATLTQKSWPSVGAATPLPENIGCQNFEPCN